MAELDTKPPEMLTLYTHLGEPVQYPKPKGKAKFNLSKGDGVSWAAWTWGPITGCLHGCPPCYARSIATNGRFSKAFPAGFTPLFHPERLDAPANTRIPAAFLNDLAYRRVFVTSMGDMFGRWVPLEWILRILERERANEQWQYIHLTQFPDRYPGLDLPTGAWIGTSVVGQNQVRIAERAMGKLDRGKVKTFLSLEPYTQHLTFTDLSMFDWVIIGARTATNQPDGRIPALAPPARAVLDLTEKALAAGCAVHWKPNLRRNPGVIGDLGPTWYDQYPASMAMGGTFHA